MIDVNEATFYIDLKNDDHKVVVVYFTAPWCGPCRMLKPTLEKLEANNPDVSIHRVDVDVCPELGADYRIMTVPTLLFYVDDDIVDESVGAKNIKVLQAIVDKHLGV